jgi:hypothetical protein
MTEKSYETKLADLIRQFGTKFEGEAIATWRALGRLLAARNVGFTDLGDAVEKLATGGLEEAEMKRLFDAGFAEGLIEAERKLAEEQAFTASIRTAPPTGWDRALLPAREGPPRAQAPSVRRRHGLAHDLGAGADGKAGQVFDQRVSPARREDEMTIAVDEGAVREFIAIISAHACELAKNVASPGVLQLTRLNCRDEKLVPTRFLIDDVEGMVKTAVNDANAGFNVYIEPRVVRADLRGPTRGTFDDTVFVFAVVVDADNDKGKGGRILARPTITVETSPGNFHYWYLFDRPVSAKQAKLIGDTLRIATGADADTGVVTQPYRVAGTPNFPSKAKQAAAVRRSSLPALWSGPPAYGIPTSSRRQ